MVPNKYILLVGFLGLISDIFQLQTSAGHNSPGEVFGNFPTPSRWTSV